MTIDPTGQFAYVTNSTSNTVSEYSTGQLIYKLNVQTGITASDTTTVQGQPANSTSLGIGGLDISSLAGAKSALSAISNAINSVAAKQSNLSASSVGLQAQSSAAASLSSNLQNTINSIRGVDQAALQAKLQQLINQQSIAYYLESQMNTEASAALTIFR
jgi:flagellin